MPRWRFAIAALALPVCVSCSPEIPRSICAMPANEQGWQGMSIHWRGMIWTTRHAHGQFTLFQDWSCGRAIPLGAGILQDVGPGVLDPARRLNTVAATYEVVGHIGFRDHRMVLNIDDATRRSEIFDQAKFDRLRDLISQRRTLRLGH